MCTLIIFLYTFRPECVMILTIDLEKESALGLRRAALLLEEAAQAKEPQEERVAPAPQEAAPEPPTKEAPKSAEAPKKPDFSSLKVY